MPKVTIIAEAGVNHNGKLSLALDLCRVARDAGADAVKFQTWKTERLLTRSAQMAGYQEKNTDRRGTQFDMVKELELGWGDFVEISELCRKIGITFLSTPDEEESLNFLVTRIGIETVKIGSAEVISIPYLRHVGAVRKPVILSTGMSTLGEVERAYDTLRQSGAPRVDLLHCTTNYPCPMSEVNLRAMVTLREAFQTRVGYSDHTLGTEVPVAAVALGAEILEKHFTLDKTMRGPDHAASLSPDELKEMIRTIRNVESALGSGRKEPNPSEIAIRSIVRKSIVASRPISAGEVFTEENLAAKRAGRSGLPVDMWDLVVGRRAGRDFLEDQAVEL
jgi:N,N'-diacetyllegionaminate synthase